MPDWITTTEAAQLSGYHPERIRELIREKKVKAVKKGNAWWVDRVSLLEYQRAANHALDRRHGPRRKPD